MIETAPMFHICYEQFIKNKSAVISKVFEFAGVTLSSPDVAREALSMDSQEGSVADRNWNKSMWTKSDPSVKWCDQIFKASSLPVCGEQYVYCFWYHVKQLLTDRTSVITCPEHDKRNLTPHQRRHTGCQLTSIPCQTTKNTRCWLMSCVCTL